MAEDMSINRTPRNSILGSFGEDSSLLFFFLILVILFTSCDMFNEMDDSLLFFFLLLVILFSGEFCCF